MTPRLKNDRILQNTPGMSNMETRYLIPKQESFQGDAGSLHCQDAYRPDGAKRKHHSLQASRTCQNGPRMAFQRPDSVGGDC